jgi:hypothetical protein
VFVLASCLWLASGAWRVTQAASPQAPPASSNYDSVLKQYCFTCHNSKLRTADLALDVLDVSNIRANADIWEKVIKKVRVGMMPPSGRPRPAEATSQGLVSWLESALDRAAAEQPNPGRPPVHRLNRIEYANAICDLLDLKIDASSLLPPDDAAYGFDNNADLLRVSPALLERYLAAAGTVSALAIGDPDAGPSAETFIVRQDASQDSHVDGLPIGTFGGMLARTTLPLDGEYVITAKLFRTNHGSMRGLENPHQLEVSVDGERVRLAAFGGEADFKALLQNPTAAGDAVNDRFTVRVKLKAGPRSIGVAFLRQTPLMPFRLQPFLRSSADTQDPTGWPHVDRFTITGPFNPSGAGDTPSRRRVFVCHPASRADENACARKIVSTLARRAYRGQVTDADLQPLFEFYQMGRRERDFDAGVQTALQRILASPKFLFRAERDPATAAPGSVFRITDLELASRLSFFLWSSIPDDELLDVARQGRLKNPAVLDQQVRRMMSDPKSDALVVNFADQWLYLRNLKNFQPNSLDFPDFDDNLRQAFQREAELFFASVVREDRSVLDLMTADYTFLNERLAKHYGVPGVYGSDFRRVTLTQGRDDARRGLLGKGAILMVTSHADRTSPVVRGKWVLENLLGAPVPPMANNVPPLPDDPNHGGRILTMRERMEEHRRNPVCATCHKIMEPIGLSMENFDATGAWRERDGGTLGTPIDASGELLDGTKIDGPITLRDALLRKPEMFVGTLAERLMTYGLGRGLTASDMPVVRGIVRGASGKNYRFSSLIFGIVRSVPFQMRIKDSPEQQNPQARAVAR